MKVYTDAEYNRLYRETLAYEQIETNSCGFDRFVVAKSQWGLVWVSPALEVLKDIAPNKTGDWETRKFTAADLIHSFQDTRELFLMKSINSLNVGSSHIQLELFQKPCFYHPVYFILRTEISTGEWRNW